MKGIYCLLILLLLLSSTASALDDNSTCADTPVPNVLSTGRSLVFVLETSTATAGYLKEIADALPGIVHGTNPSWFTNFIIASFKPGESLDTAGVYSSVVVENAASRIRFLADHAPTAPPSCNETSALSDAATLLASPKYRLWSPNAEVVFLSTSGAPSTYHDVVTLLSGLGNQLPTFHHLFLNLNTCSHSTSPLVDITRGLSLWLNPQATDTPAVVTNFLSVLIPARFQAASIPLDGLSETSVQFQVDAAASEVFVFSAAQVAGGCSPKGDNISLTTLASTWGSELSSFTPTAAGTFQISFTGAWKNCDLRIWARGSAGILFGFNQFPSEPSVHEYGSSQRDNFPVFRPWQISNGVVSLSGNMDGHVDIELLVNETYSEHLFSTDSTVRPLCVYDFVGSNFACKSDGLLRVTMRTKDLHDFPFTRYAYTFCKDEGPLSTTAAPSTVPTTPFIPCQTAPLPNLAMHNRTLVLVVETSNATAEYLSAFASALTATVADVNSKHSEWYTNFIVADFKPGNGLGSYIYDSPLASNAAARIKFLAQWATAEPQCENDGAIRDIAFNLAYKFKSVSELAEVFFITSSNLHSDDNDLLGMIKTFGNRMPTLNVITVARPECSPSSPPIVEQLRGIFAFVHTTDELTQLFALLLGERFASDDLADNQRSSCDEHAAVNVNQYVESDFYLLVNNASLIGVQNISGGEMEFAEIFGGEGTKVYSITPETGPGVHMFNFSSDNANCNLRSWSKGGMGVLFGFSYGREGAEVYEYARPDYYNYPVFRAFHTVDGSDLTQGGKVSFITLRNMSGSELFKSSTFSRPCFYSQGGAPGDGVCETDGPIRADLIMGDGDGNVFTQRQWTWCNRDAPPPTSTAPPSTTVLSSSPKPSTESRTASPSPPASTVSPGTSPTTKSIRTDPPPGHTTTTSTTRQPNSIVTEQSTTKAAGSSAMSLTLTMFVFILIEIFA